MPLAYELSDMDMSILGQEPVSRDWQGITNVSDPDHEGETSEEEKCLPSIYNLQTYNSHKGREPTIQMTEAGATTRPPYNVWNPISQPHIASGSQVVADRYLPEGGIIKTEAESNKYLLPEQLEKDIDARALPELSVFFPDHPIKAAMESYLTRGQGLEPAGILYAKARCDVRFGIVNQLANQEITHFKAEMQCPGLHKSVESCKKHRMEDERTPAMLRDGAFFFIKRKSIPVSIGDDGDWVQLEEGNDFNDPYKFSHCLKMPGAKSKELQIRFRFKVRERTTFKEQVIERLFPIRILANPGRDCKEIALRPSNRTPSFPWASTWNTLSTFTPASIPGMISPTAILSAVDDEAFNTKLTEDEKTAFCEEEAIRLTTMIRTDARIFLSRKRKHSNDDM